MNFRLLAIMGFLCLAGTAQAGYIEICKDSSPSGSVTGLFSFTVAGQAGTFPAPVGACTPAIQLPDGPAVITETLQAGSILLSVSTFPTTRLISFSTTLADATILTVPGDISTQTVVTFTNTPASSGPNIPEPGTAWFLGLGIGLGAVRGILPKRSFFAAARFAAARYRRTQTFA